jgi:two-component system chemotaxis sensor kinase CheA
MDSLAQCLLMAEPGDPSTFERIQEQLESLRQTPGLQDTEGFCGALDRALEIVDRHLNSPDDSPPEEVLAEISEAVSALQKAAETAQQDATPSASPESTDGDPPKSDLFEELSPAADRQILDEFLDSRTESLLRIEEIALELEKSETGDNEPREEELKRLLHTLKGEAGMLGLGSVERLCHRLETSFESGDPSAVFAERLLESKDWLAEAFGAYRHGQKAPTPVESLIEKIDESPPDESERTDVQGENEEEANAFSVTVADGPQESWADAGDNAEPGTRQTPTVLTEDPDMVVEFVEESLEHLHAADTQLLQLETNPEEADALNAVFRAFHTIKGLAGFFELDHIQELSHKAENLLDAARDGDIILKGAVADCAFDSVDLLKALVSDVRSTIETGDALPHREGVRDLISRIRRILAGDIPASQEEAEESEVPPDLRVGEILVESGAITRQELDEALEQQREENSGPPLFGELVITAAEISSHKVVELLEAVSESLDGERRRQVEELLEKKEEITREDIARVLQKHPPQSKKIGETLVERGSATGKQVARALRGQKKARSGKAPTAGPDKKVHESIRVDASRLDHLIETIGEMVIAQSMVQQSLDGVKTNQSAGVQRKLDRLDKMTRELQEVGMSLRMVPIRATFQKMARLVRDLSRKSGKKVEFNMSGEHTELDKSLVDQIGDPLVHLIRNAVDHGIETPEERTASGKPATGQVALRAFHEGGNIFIEVEDDGGGLNRRAILNKARERGVIQDGEELSDEEVYNLIFRPGFSTNEEVTDISGRGVGMDVVKRNIEAMRGQVEVRSRPGEGSTFSIRLPLTLAIIDGMVIRVGEERYVLPTLSIEQSVRPKPREISSVLEQGRMLEFQGHEIPMYHLGELFGIPEAQSDCTRGLVVVVECEDREVGLVVDELLGQQQIVIKSLGGGLQEKPGLSGGAIMPDGKVALILDIAGLVMLAENTARPEPGWDEVPAEAEPLGASAGH